VDSNQSGTISFDEFASWWSRRTVATGGALDEELIGRMQQQWAELDTDGSGDLGTQGPHRAPRLVSSSSFCLLGRRRQRV
jgi:hypothetical protein